MVVVTVALACMLGVFVYWRHSHNRFDPTDWLQMAYPTQDNSDHLLAIGTTVTTNGANRGINSLSIRLARHSHELVAITFTAIHDQTFYFHREVIDVLQSHIGHYERLKERLRGEHRPDYREEIGNLVVFATARDPRSIRIYFHQEPEWMRIRDGKTETKGTRPLLELSFPFPLEATEAFQSTEILIDAAGVAKLQVILDQLRKTYEEKREVF